MALVFSLLLEDFSSGESNNTRNLVEWKRFYCSIFVEIKGLVWKCAPTNGLGAFSADAVLFGGLSGRRWDGDVDGRDLSDGVERRFDLGFVAYYDDAQLGLIDVLVGYAGYVG
jgi:hypothetical protein